MGRESPAPGGGKPRVELRLAGAFAVFLNGTELTEREIGSRKSRTLLKVLAASRPGMVAAEQLAELLWDGDTPAGADRNIASLVSRLRAVLGTGVIRGGRSGYRLGDAADVSVDLDAAGRLCATADSVAGNLNPVGRAYYNLQPAVHAERAVAAWWLRPRRAGRGGGYPAGHDRRRIHQVPPGRGDAIQPCLRSAPVAPGSATGRRGEQHDYGAPAGPLPASAAPVSVTIASQEA